MKPGRRAKKWADSASIEYKRKEIQAGRINRYPMRSGMRKTGAGARSNDKLFDTANAVAMMGAVNKAVMTVDGAPRALRDRITPPVGISDAS